MEGKKPVQCVIVDDKFVYGLHEGEDGTPAVAVTVEDYKKVREAFVWIIDNHAQDDEVPFCRECGAAGGRWPCATTLEAKAALAILPEIPQ